MSPEMPMFPASFGVGPGAGRFRATHATSKAQSPRRTLMADKTLNKNDLVAAVAADSGQSQATVSGVVDAFFATLAKSVGEGTKVSIPGWLASSARTAPLATAATRDGRRHPDRRRLRRQGLRRQQAQGCRQVSAFHALRRRASTTTVGAALVVSPGSGDATAAPAVGGSSAAAT